MPQTDLTMGLGLLSAHPSRQAPIAPALEDVFVINRLWFPGNLLHDVIIA
jgi:hypothetical protein